MGYSVNRRYLVLLSCLWHVYFVWVLWLKVSIIDLYGHFLFIFLCKTRWFFCVFGLRCGEIAKKIGRSIVSGVAATLFGGLLPYRNLFYLPSFFFDVFFLFVRSFLFRLFRIAKICIRLFGLFVSVRIGRFFGGRGFLMSFWRYARAVFLFFL